ncbi:MAG TPA: hypothetical protein VMM80_07735 [Bacteroidota bacterium]|nr:hypothetical protein [Bacteroidota bacterium]
MTDSSGNRARRTGIILSVLLAATVLLIYCPLVSFPFVQDDWAMIHRFVFHDPGSVITDALAPAGKFFYRPLAVASCLALYGMFGLNAAGFHALALLILGSSAFLVVAIARALTADRTVAWTSGFLFACAASVHFDSQMWLVGIFDTGATLLALLCVLAFLRKRYLLSGIALAAAMGFKESVALLLPAIAALALLEGTVGARGMKGILEIVRKIRWHAAATALFAAVKFYGTSPFALPETHPYAARLLGSHIVTNLRLYSTWALQGVTPLKAVSFSRTWGEIVLIAALAVIAILALTALRRRGGDAGIAGRRAAAFALIWFICMLAPPLTLKTHIVRYYLTGALPPLALGAALVLRAAARTASRSTGVTAIACVLFVAACAADGFFMVRGKTALGLADGVHASSDDGDDHLVRKATVVEQTMKPLLTALPTLPAHTLVVMEGIETFCFAGRYGLQVWYRDSTLLLSGVAPGPPDSAGLTHATLPPPDPWVSPEPVEITLPSAHVVRVRRDGDRLEIVRP